MALALLLNGRLSALHNQGAVDDGWCKRAACLGREHCAYKHAQTQTTTGDTRDIAPGACYYRKTNELWTKIIYSYTSTIVELTYPQSVQCQINFLPSDLPMAAPYILTFDPSVLLTLKFRGSAGASSCLVIAAPTMM